MNILCIVLVLLVFVKWAMPYGCGPYGCSPIATLTPKAPCSDGFVQIGRQCFQINIGRMKWNKSARVCEKRSARLAEPKDPMALRDYIIQHFPKSSFWIGGVQSPKDMTWKWVSGLPIATSFPWGINDRGSPQHKGDKQNCMVLKYFPNQDEQEYVDNFCKKKRGFVCEKLQSRIEVCTITCDHGDCDASTNTCMCDSGWGGTLCNEQKASSLTQYPSLIEVCTTTCGHGDCDASTDTCTCEQGWGGTLCDQKVCTIICGHGDCDASTDTCTCDQGWGGILCDQKVCTITCGHGDCDASTDTCTCDQGWGGTLCDQKVCTITCGHGDCDTTTDTCTCDQGWEGTLCDQKTCSASKDFFEIVGSCYKVLKDKTVPWQDAKDKCASEGLSLVSKPQDPISLRKYLVDTYGFCNVWLDARGDGSRKMYRWQQDNSSLSFRVNRDPLWYSSEPSPAEAHGEQGCLCMIGSRHHMALELNSPYAGCVCYHPGAAYPLCE